MTLNLEVGKRYRTRDGRVAVIEHLDATARIWPFCGRIEGDVSGRTWDAYGAYDVDDGPLDIISEIPDEPKEAKPMVKMVVRDEKREPEKVIEWWLEQGAERVYLKCRRAWDVGDGGWIVATIRPNGIQMFGSCRGAGFPVDDLGRIKVID